MTTTAQAPTASNPLTWPIDWPRTDPGDRRWARFTRRLSVAVALDEVEEEVRRLGGRNLIVSTDLKMRLDGRPMATAKAPENPGVAVYFDLEGEPTVLACDTWNTVAHNLRAIAKTIDAMRGMDRWGVGSMKRAFAGYKALPAPGEGSRQAWWLVLWPDECELPSHTTQAEIRARAADLIRAHHPDTGDGNMAKLQEVLDARREGLEAVDRE